MRIKMNIVYKEQKNYTPKQLQGLFPSVNWESGHYPNRLVKAMENSSLVISAWDGDKLVGLVRSLDDGATVAFVHYLLVDPAYQKFHIGSGLMERLLHKYEDFLYVKIMPSDPATVPFYEKLGFRQQDNYCAMVINHMDRTEDFLPDEL